VADRDHQLRVALTGGVGAGKSELGRALAQLGAVRIDADAVAREVVSPGSPGLDQVSAAFGTAVLDESGALDRAAMAALVFTDPDARQRLNAITHPLVARRSEELMAAAGPGAVVVYEIPLLAETGRRDDFDLVVVVEAPVADRLARLAKRGLTEAQARQRIAAQASDEQRRAIADEVVHNKGDLAALHEAARCLWQRLELLSRGQHLPRVPD
jgi:dephospho-CoA kinase